MVSSKRRLVMFAPGLAEMLAVFQLYSVATHNHCSRSSVSQRIPWCLQMPTEYFSVLPPDHLCCHVLQLPLPATCYVFAWCMPETCLFLSFVDVLPDDWFCVYLSDTDLPPDCDTSNARKITKLIFCILLKQGDNVVVLLVMLWSFSVFLLYMVRYLCVGYAYWRIKRNNVSFDNDPKTHTGTHHQKNKQIFEHIIRMSFKNKSKHVCGKVCSAKSSSNVDVFDLTFKLNGNICLPARQVKQNKSKQNHN